MIRVSMTRVSMTRLCFLDLIELCEASLIGGSNLTCVATATEFCFKTLSFTPEPSLAVPYSQEDYAE
jgi:hypothetical protein